MGGAPAVGVGRVLVRAERAGAARPPRFAKRHQPLPLLLLLLLSFRLLVEYGLDEG